MPTPFDRTRAAIAADLVRAIKARESVAVAALRAALHALDNATATADAPPAVTEVPRHLPSVPRMASLLRATAASRRAAAAEFRRLERQAQADDLEREARIIGGCLRHLGSADAGAP